MDRTQDSRVRAAAFAWLAEQVDWLGTDVLPYALLKEGFQLDGTRVPLLGPQGIFKPRVMEGAPLSITTVHGGPYDDAFGPDGLLRYRYRGTDPNHPDNRRLRTAYENRLPLIYFHGIAKGKYMAAWPVYIIGDDPANLVVTVAVDDVQHVALGGKPAEIGRDDATAARRNYMTALVRVRLHQRSFRERVLEAYQRQCAFCRLRHEELLDAAHIVPDSHPRGEPTVQNGLALCTLHHSAFDRLFIGLRPDYVIEVRGDILREKDGPTLAHAIQGMHGRSIVLPRSVRLHPDRDLLAVRYSEFKRAG
jgi:putative restriction endonuclease